MQYYIIVHTTISERYDRKQNSHNSDVQKQINDINMKNNKRNNNSTRRRNNNHYQNHATGTNVITSTLFQIKFPQNQNGP